MADGKQGRALNYYPSDNIRRVVPQPFIARVQDLKKGPSRNENAI